MRDGEISLKEISLLKESREARTNIENLYNARKGAIDFFEEFTSRASEARPQAKKETGLKIPTPKKRLQRLPMTLAQEKAGSNSESLLNEVRQILYSLYQSKEITNKCITT